MLSEQERNHAHARPQRNNQGGHSLRASRKPRRLATVGRAGSVLGLARLALLAAVMLLTGAQQASALTDVYVHKDAAVTGFSIVEVAFHLNKTVTECPAGAG